MHVLNLWIFYMPYIRRFTVCKAYPILLHGVYCKKPKYSHFNYALGQNWITEVLTLILVASHLIYDWKVCAKRCLILNPKFKPNFFPLSSICSTLSCICRWKRWWWWEGLVKVAASFWAAIWSHALLIIWPASHQFLRTQYECKRLTLSVII